MQYIITTILIVLGLGGIFWLINKPEKPCLEYRSVVEIQVIPLENFWGKELRYIVNYDNGSIYETDMGDLYSIGEKECIKS